MQINSYGRYSVTAVKGVAVRLYVDVKRHYENISRRMRILYETSSGEAAI
jgi:hypothetical protein